MEKLPHGVRLERLDSDEIAIIADQTFTGCKLNKVSNRI